MCRCQVTREQAKKTYMPSSTSSNYQNENNFRQMHMSTRPRMHMQMMGHRPKMQMMTDPKQLNAGVSWLRRVTEAAAKKKILMEDPHCKLVDQLRNHKFARSLHTRLEEFGVDTPGNPSRAFGNVGESPHLLTTTHALSPAAMKQKQKRRQDSADAAQKNHLLHYTPKIPTIPSCKKPAKRHAVMAAMMSRAKVNPESSNGNNQVLSMLMARPTNVARIANMNKPPAGKSPPVMTARNQSTLMLGAGNRLAPRPVIRVPTRPCNSTNPPPTRVLVPRLSQTHKSELDMLNKILVRINEQKQFLAKSMATSDIESMETSR
eukprot:m.7039 g.7039  ORF g.7039 m.7039 type:complete len:319 (-) comp3638_c0_seq1:173-1129(-)